MDTAGTDGDMVTKPWRVEKTSKKKRELLPKNVDSSHLYPALVEGSDGNRDVLMLLSPEWLKQSDEKQSTTYKKKRKPARRWTFEEEAKLVELHERHGSNWSAIAKEMGNRNVHQCRQKWVLSLDPSLKKGVFSRSEDLRLYAYAFFDHTPNWPAIAKTIPGRTAKQCRERCAYLKKHSSY